MIRERLKALLKTLVENNRFNSAFRPVILNLANGFLDGVSELELAEGVAKLRDEIIPWILNEAQDENTPKG